MNVDSRYLVNIDSILDTRLATLASLDQDFALQVMQDPSYTTRQMDTFMENSGAVSSTLYWKTYKKRNKFILALATPTFMFKWLQDMVLEDMRDPNFQTPDRKVEFVLNIWPYTLDNAERNSLIQIIKEHIPALDSVLVWSMSPQQLSPSNIKMNKITTFVDYDLNAWMELHEHNLNECVMPDVTFVGPELLSKEVDYSVVPGEHREKLKEMGPFRCAELVASPYVNLVLTPVGNFCSVLITPVKSA